MMNKPSGKPAGNVICYDCRRPIQDCPWLREEQPVPGWDAEPVKKMVGTNEHSGPVIVDTFQIHSCPLRL